MIIASKDDVGGTLTVIENIDSKRIVTIFYGVSFKNVPHLRKAGNAVVPYPVVMLYAGWVQGVSLDSAINAKTIWAVGNKYGLKAVYKPYGIQLAENTSDYYGGDPIAATVGGVSTDDGDSATGDETGIASVPTVTPDGVSSTMAPSTVTWTSPSTDTPADAPEES